MKRSQTNRIIAYAIDVLKKAGYPLPPFAFYGPEEWKKLPAEEIELVENMLGWDITDFGSGDFDRIGLTIFTFRNGNFHLRDKYPKPYAEKMLLVNDGQILPYHYHWSKMEDIINRGGGDLELTMYNADAWGFPGCRRRPCRKARAVRRHPGDRRHRRQKSHRAGGRHRDPEARPEHHAAARPVPLLEGRPRNRRRHPV